MRAAANRSLSMACAALLASLVTACNPPGQIESDAGDGQPPPRDAGVQNRDVVGPSDRIQDPNGDGPASTDSEPGDGAPLAPAPEVVSITPADGESNVSTRTSIRVQFSQPLDPATVNGMTLNVSTATGTIAGTVTYSIGAGATFTPDGPLGLRTPYTVTISGTIMGTDGQTLAGGSVQSAFTTIEGTWSDPLQLYPSPAVSPTVAIEDSGDALVAFQPGEAGGGPIQARLYDSAARQWGTSQLLSPEGTGFEFQAQNPQAAGDGAGAWVVGWSQQGSPPRAFANRFDTATGWGGPTPVSNNSATYNADSPAIDLNRAGDGLALWVEGLSNGQIGDRLLANRMSGGDWLGPVEVPGAATATFVVYPHLGIDADGNGIVVWWQYVAGRYGIWSNSYHYRQGWEPTAVALDTGNGQAGDLAFASTLGGNAALLWQQIDSPTQSIFANRRIAGSWVGPEPVGSHDFRAGDLVGVAVAVDDAGGVAAVWSEGATNQAGNLESTLWATRYAPGSGWSPAEMIGLPMQDSRSVYPSLAVDGKGAGVLVWQQETMMTGSDGSVTYDETVYSRRLDPVSGWEPITALSTSGQATNPLVRVNNRGRAAVVWTDYLNGSMPVVYATVLDEY
jgi:hypothetical protein